MPRYSVIIPTTRARLLKYSVRSVLAQTCADFEIVVSDNFSNGVQEALKEFSDPRVRYVRTPQRLAINKSWEYALDNACGEWVLLLADDDVILPTLLDEINEGLRQFPHAEIATWRHGGFVEGTYHSAALRLRLSSPPYSGRVYLADNRETLARLYALGGTPEKFADVKRFYPGIAYSGYKMDLIRRVKARVGALFMPTTPDYAAGAAVLALSESTMIIDKPLMIFHSTSDSNSAAASGDLTTVKQVYAELTNEPFKNVPFKGYLTNRNVIADTLLDMRKLIPEKLGVYDIDIATYFKNVYFGLHLVRQQSGPTPIVLQEQADLLAALETQPPEVQAEVRAYIQTLTSQAAAGARSPVIAAYLALRNWLRELASGLLLRWYPLGATRTRRQAREIGISTRGSFAGIGDIYECAQVLGRIIGWRRPERDAAS